jgi:hypothetical protein
MYAACLRATAVMLLREAQSAVNIAIADVCTMIDSDLMLCTD